METLKRVASLSDIEIKSEIEGSEQNKEQVLAFLRTYKTKDDSNGFLALAQKNLSDTWTNYKNADYEMAKKNALHAYLDGIEPMEGKLRAIDPQAVIEIEELMSAVRSTIQQQNNHLEVENTIAKATNKVEEIKLLLTEKEMSPWMAFLSSFAIILREGFEAVLIIIALLGVTRSVNSRRAALYVHGGWLTALAFGIIAWTFSGWLMDMSGASREKMEGFVSLFAVMVLLYVGFWLHRSTEIGRWKSFLEVKVRGFVTGGKLLGLALIAFIAAFREVLETVVFLRAFWLELTPDAKMALLAGVVVALFLVIALSWAALNFSKRLPLKKLFTFSSFIMLILATILAGKGVHSLQEAGIFDVHQFPLRIRVELFGLYPTVQSLGAQFLTALIVMTLWSYGQRPSLERVKTNR